jgi:hypothetical protein
VTAVQRRWERKLEGAFGGPAGEWDRFILLALRLGWTEQDIWQSSPDFIDELIARLNAETAVGLRQAQAAARREAQLAAEKQREAHIGRLRSANAAVLRKMHLKPGGLH